MFRLEYYGNRPQYSYSSDSQGSLYDYTAIGTTTSSLPILTTTNNIEEIDFNNNIQGCLKKVTYSTSGYEFLEYEPNRTNFNFYKKSPNYWTNATYDKSIESFSINNQSNQKIVNIPFRQTVKLEVTSSCFGGNGFSEATASFSSSGFPSSISFLYGNSSMLNSHSYKEGSFINQNTGGGTCILILEQGQYMLNTETDSNGSNSRAKVKLSYNDIERKDFYLGGFRIKSKKIVDINGNEMKTLYKYIDSTNTSSAYIKISYRDAFARMSSCSNSSTPQHPRLVRDLYPNFQITSNNTFTPVKFNKIDNNNMHYETINEEFYFNNQFKGFNKYNYYGDFSNINLLR